MQITVFVSNASSSKKKTIRFKLELERLGKNQKYDKNKKNLRCRKNRRKKNDAGEKPEKHYQKMITMDWTIITLTNMKKNRPKKKPSANIAISAFFSIRCRTYGRIFEWNNKFHKQIKNGCYVQIYTMFQKKFPIPQRFALGFIPKNNPMTLLPRHQNAEILSQKIPIIVFTIDFNIILNIEYGFRISTTLLLNIFNSKKQARIWVFQY